LVAQGELWLLETPNEKRRPVLIVTRNEAIRVLNNVVVAPVTSTIRTIPTCIPVGPEEGIDHESVATFDNMAAVPKRLLTTRLGRLGPSGRNLMCSALRSLADC
jgi:mRNA interferase MazF